MEQDNIFIYHSQGIFKIIPQICYYELENQVQLSVQPKKNVRVCLALDIILAVLRRLSDSMDFCVSTDWLQKAGENFFSINITGCFIS